MLCMENNEMLYIKIQRNAVHKNQKYYFNLPKWLLNGLHIGSTFSRAFEGFFGSASFFSMSALPSDPFVSSVGAASLHSSSSSSVLSSCFKITFLWASLSESSVFVVLCGFSGGLWPGPGCGDWCMLSAGDFVTTPSPLGRSLVEDWTDSVEFPLNRSELRLLPDKSWLSFPGRADDGNVNSPDLLGEGLIPPPKFCKAWWWPSLGGDIMLLVGVCGAENCPPLWWTRPQEFWLTTRDFIHKFIWIFYPLCIK